LRDDSSLSIREKTAKEAAILLYTSQEQEYRQAKLRAAKALGTRALPSNREVAEELDRLADEMEGLARKERLVQMRKDALSLMVLLGDLHPRLVGSVWRGTAHRNSDIDVEVFNHEPEAVLLRLRQSGMDVSRAQWQSVTKERHVEIAFHINLALVSGNEAEVIVRDPEKMNEAEKCEIYGDPIKGLNMHQLRRVMARNPLQKFVPF